MSQPCVFCEIIAGRAPATWITEPDYWPDTVAFVPLNPVTEGHALIVPKVHVPDFAAVPEVFAVTARRAAELMRWTPRPMNVITSRGVEATQSVFHLHLHLVPRAAGDGLALPWHSGKGGRIPASGAHIICAAPAECPCVACRTAAHQHGGDTATLPD